MLDAYEALAQKAFKTVIAIKQSEARRLAEEYAANRHRLLEFINVEENEHGL